MLVFGCYFVYLYLLEFMWCIEAPTLLALFQQKRNKKERKKERERERWSAWKWPHWIKNINSLIPLHRERSIIILRTVYWLKIWGENIIIPCGAGRILTLGGILSRQDLTAFQKMDSTSLNAMLLNVWGDTTYAPTDEKRTSASAAEGIYAYMKTSLQKTATYA